jgi:hypothetical protein
MANYILRRIDEDLWSRFKARAEDDGIPMRVLILRLVEMYADGKLSLGMKKSSPQG